MKEGQDLKSGNVILSLVTCESRGKSLLSKPPFPPLLNENAVVFQTFFKQRKPFFKSSEPQLHTLLSAPETPSWNADALLNGLKTAERTV